MFLSTKRTNLIIIIDLLLLTIFNDFYQVSIYTNDPLIPQTEFRGIMVIIVDLVGRKNTRFPEKVYLYIHCLFFPERACKYLHFALFS